MATVKEYADQLTAKVADLKAEVAKIPAAVDAFEARVTDLINNSQIPQDVQDQFNAALNDLTTVTDGVKAAVADAADGIDEAVAQQPTG